MDYADDITYSVHDVEDFHRIRAVPWHLLSIERKKTPPEMEASELIDAALESWKNAPPDAKSRLVDASKEIITKTRSHGPFLYSEPYEGTREQRISLRNWTSDLIRRFVRDLRPKIVATRGGGFKLRVHPAAEAEIQLLKQIVRRFVIEEPAIGAQQLGQRRIVREVYDDLIEDVAQNRAKGTRLRYLPIKFRYLIDDKSDPVSNARLVADVIASLTERELIALHRRLRGESGGSVIDPIVR
jgi:dGTPase